MLILYASIFSLCRYRIIKRRVLWLLGCWVGVKFDSAYHPSLYQYLVNSLGPNEDIVVFLSLISSNSYSKNFCSVVYLNFCQFMIEGKNFAKLFVVCAVSPLVCILQFLYQFCVIFCENFSQGLP